MVLHVAVPDCAAAHTALASQRGVEVTPIEAPDAAAAAAAGSFPSGGFFALDATGYAVQVSQIEQR